MSEYFPKPKIVGKKNESWIRFIYYATKADLKNVTEIGRSKFTKKVDLASLKYEIDKSDIENLEKAPSGLKSLKSKVDKLDVDKLEPVPADLSKLSDVVKNDVVKKTEYNQLVKKINAI